MLTQRTTSLLRAVSDVRDWVVASLPMTSSMVGYDLFLKLGEAFLAGRAVALPGLYASLRYSPKTIRRQLDKFAAAELVSFDWPAGLHHPRAVQPTPRFQVLLDEYRRKFDSLFIVRAPLRQQQFGVAVDDPALGQLAADLYDHFYDLGWLYADTYGSMCFLISMLAERAAQAHGHAARLLSCYVDINAAGRRFLLGGQGFAAPGQIEGHAVCLVDEHMLLDFGLGNARRGYRRDFPWALAAHYQPAGSVAGGVTLREDETVIWRTDWQAPNTDEEIQRLSPVAERLFAQYRQRYL
ncbi:hypothetical protein [Massilia sp. TS11]|uniref:hypothetical protein n=1 Tax=Massilia sp. TS11 TaxID=2908003 RepID=UPI001EDB3853|nr:hypothetical protein [Massilia sp. TS11]MCG2585089.1 hypothetical protein [Massilia sp. TS11]